MHMEKLKVVGVRVRVRARVKVRVRAGVRVRVRAKANPNPNPNPEPNPYQVGDTMQFKGPLGEYVFNTAVIHPRTGLPVAQLDGALSTFEPQPPTPTPTPKNPTTRLSTF